jgi:hypothetical protein
MKRAITLALALLTLVPAPAMADWSGWRKMTMRDADRATAIAVAYVGRTTGRTPPCWPTWEWFENVPAVAKAYAYTFPNTCKGWLRTSFWRGDIPVRFKLFCYAITHEVLHMAGYGDHDSAEFAYLKAHPPRRCK